MAWVLTLAVAAGVARRLDLLLVLVCVVLAAGVFRRHFRERFLLVMVAGAAAVLGWSSVVRFERDRAGVERVSASAGAALVTLEGTVSGFPQTGNHGTRFDFDTVVGARRVRVQVRAERFDVAYGDRYRLRARFTRPAAPVSAFLRSRSLAGSVRVRSADMTYLGRGGNPVLRECFWPLHRFARTRLSRAMGKDSGLAIGMLLGERAQLDDPVRDAVRRLGITHLLAISGMHLTTVAGCVVLCTRRWPRRRAFALVAALTVYTATVGDVESLTRAYFMALIMITMGATLRPLRAIDALGTTWFVMTVAEPLSLSSVGLQLSFAATFAVLLCLPHLVRRKAAHESAARRWVRGGVHSLAAAFIMSVAVELCIAPLQLHHFHVISAVGPVATVVFLVPVTVILVSSAPVAALAALVPAHEWPGQALGALSTLTSSMIVACGRAAPPPLPIPAPDPWLYYGGLLVAWRVRRRRAAWLVAAVLLAMAFR